MQKQEYPERMTVYGCLDCRSLWLKTDEYTRIGAMPRWEKLSNEEKKVLITRRWNIVDWVHGPCPSCQEATQTVQMLDEILREEQVDDRAER